MAEHDAQAPVTMEELLVTSDALAKLLIENGLITQAELMTKILEERAVYQRMLKRRYSEACGLCHFAKDSLENAIAVERTWACRRYSKKRFATN